jgi:hypothetical protein
VTRTTHEPLIARKTTLPEVTKTCLAVDPTPVVDWLGEPRIKGLFLAGYHIEDNRVNNNVIIKYFSYKRIGPFHANIVTISMLYC